YCVFGRVVEGMDVVDQIAATPAEANGDFRALPKTPVVIQSIERVQ
ncbi:MAG: peptidylprolyl isomerase, partial [Planctomycetales bacterium]|nr:peptidylprolyl isomerase [Planctomycetales bacterium]